LLLSDRRLGGGLAADAESERGVMVPTGADVRGRAWAVGTLRVARHPRRVWEDGLVFPAFAEVLKILDR
jgi:hypothetical protein